MGNYRTPCSCNRSRFHQTVVCTCQGRFNQFAPQFDRVDDCGCQGFRELVPLKPRKVKCDIDRKELRKALEEALEDILEEALEDVLEDVLKKVLKDILEELLEKKLDKKEKECS